jgi:hypothetical protein
MPRHFSLCLAVLVLLMGAGAVFAMDWTPADPPAGPGAMAPSLTPTPNGLLLTWLEPGAAQGGRRGHALRFSRYRDGRWSAPVTIAAGKDFFANWADFPAVAQAQDGSLTAHWLAKTGDATYAYGIFLARSTDGGATWSPAGLLHSDGLPTEHGFVSWVPEGNGLRAVWLDGREMLKEGPMTLRTGMAGQKETEQVLDARVCDCCQTDAALAADGPVVVFRDRSDKEIRDISIVRKTAAGWSQPARVHADDWEIPGCPVNGPAVAAAGKKVAVAWFTAAAPKGPRVQIAFSEDGGQSFGPPVLIDGEQPLGRVDLQLDASGDAIVSWMGFQEKGAAVRLRRVSAKGVASAPMTIAETSAARSAGFPRSSVSGDRLWLAWVEDAPAKEGTASKVRVASLPLSAVR